MMQGQEGQNPMHELVEDGTVHANVGKVWRMRMPLHEADHSHNFIIIYL